MFVKPHNFTSVSFMYRDLLNLKFIVTNNDDECNKFLFKKKDKIIIGFENSHSKSWDEYFYYQHNIDFSHRWDSFKVDRDMERELKLYGNLNPTNEEYVIVHKKGSDGIDRIDYSKIDGNFKKIFVENYTDNIFDYLTLIERAKEIHCIESSFHVLVDSLELNLKLYFHTNKNNRGFNHKIKQNWNIV